MASRTGASFTVTTETVLTAVLLALSDSSYPMTEMLREVLVPPAVGSPDGPRDREVLGVTAGDPRLDQSSVDLHVSAVSTGFGRTPFMLRVLGNGQLLDTRRVVPSADGSPIDETFTVSPDHSTATVYTAEIPPDEAEPVVENNARSVLVSPAGRKPLSASTSHS